MPDPTQETEENPLSPPVDEPWKAELGDLRTSVQAMQQQLAEKEREAAYWRGQADARVTRDEPVKPAVLEDVPEAAFLEAVDQGDTVKLVKLIRQQNEISAARAVQNLRQEMQPIVNDFTGSLGILSSHTKKLVAAGMPFVVVPEVEKDMQQFLSVLSPAQQATEEGLMNAYHLALGKNHEAVEAYKQKERDRRALEDTPEPGGGPRSTRGRNLREAYIPSPEDLGGGDALRAANAKGGSDALARKLGYQNWNDYMKQCGMEEGATAQ